ncbi:MAG: hypothetical protein U0R44_00595 [Candidatus Micrarchaeia archaeon]
MLFISLFAAFNVSDYLFPEEKNASIAYNNFTINGTSYSIVKIAGTDSFLLKNGDPVTGQSELESTLYAYYLKTYYPSAGEMKNLSDLIKRFNDSRNDGYDYKGKEEYICRNDILLSAGKITVSGKPVICRDNESCTKNAMLLFSIYGEGLNLGSPTTLIQPLYDFTPSSLRMDDILANYTQKLNSTDESTIADTMSYISGTAGELKNLSLKIEGTIFRTPRLNDSADRKACQLKCFAICPSMDLDQAAADGIKSTADTLLAKLAPLKNYKPNSADLYNRTTSRLEHVKTEDMATFYKDEFKPLNDSGDRIISMGNDALGHVQNKSLTEKLDSLKSLHVTIPEDIAGRNFTGLDEDISRYKNLSSEVENGSAFLLSHYNQTKNAKNIENSLLLVLESKDLDPVSLKSLELLKNQTEDLNARFRDGLTLAQLNALGDNYSALTESAQTLLKTESNTPATRVLLLFRGFARKVNTGIATVAEKNSVVKPTDIPDNPLLLVSFSALVFLSFGSMIMLAFLHVFSMNRFKVPKTAHILGAAFFSLIILLLVFSMFLYLFLGKTSSDATLPEFLSDFNSKNSTSIVVDLRNASLSDAQAMRVCAGTLADSFSEKNKSWSLYTITQNTCSQADSLGGNSSLSFTQCKTDIEKEDSSFILKYSSSNAPPKFSIIYQNRAEIKANQDYYESCPLVALFS